MEGSASHHGPIDPVRASVLTAQTDASVASSGPKSTTTTRSKKSLGSMSGKKLKKGAHAVIAVMTLDTKRKKKKKNDEILAAAAATLAASKGGGGGGGEARSQASFGQGVSSGPTRSGHVETSARSVPIHTISKMPSVSQISVLSGNSSDSGETPSRSIPNQRKKLGNSAKKVVGVLRMGKLLSPSDGRLDILARRSGNARPVAYGQNATWEDIPPNNPERRRNFLKSQGPQNSVKWAPSITNESPERKPAPTVSWNEAAISKPPVDLGPGPSSYDLAASAQQLEGSSSSLQYNGMGYGHKSEPNIYASTNPYGHADEGVGIPPVWGSSGLDSMGSVTNTRLANEEINDANELDDMLSSASRKSMGSSRSNSKKSVGSAFGKEMKKSALKVMKALRLATSTPAGECGHGEGDHTEVANLPKEVQRRRMSVKSELSEGSVDGEEGGYRAVRRRSRISHVSHSNRLKANAKKVLDTVKTATVANAFIEGDGTVSVGSRGRRNRIRISESMVINAQERRDSGIAFLAETDMSFLRFSKRERWLDWASSFRRMDPRFQILRFFNDVAREGTENLEESGLNPELISPLLRCFVRSSVFTVWRPTSLDAIRKMMTGEGTGKGLDIKGKSAKRGMLSGYVPFMQIHEEEHKRRIQTLPKDGKIRVFYSNRERRNEAEEYLQPLLRDMIAEVAAAKATLASPVEDDDILENAMQKLVWDMDKPSITLIDDYVQASCFGIEIPQRLFWEGYAIRQDCSRDPDSKYATGRPSEPSFQDMNFASVRKKVKEGSPRPVVWSFPDAEHAMCPKSLLMAYEEHGKVLPVVSDFDCFIMGTRGVRYRNPLPPDQLEVMKWCISETQNILNSPPSDMGWTQRWLEVLKVSATKGFHPHIPQFGFSDPQSNLIIEHAVERMSQNGAVRHGAECFNYYFPQELDDHFLVISETLGPPGTVPWKYVNVQELQDILCQRIDQGFTFPLNPKWVLCDPGWKRVYDKLLSSEKPNVKDSMACWYPPESGLREIIEEIYSQNPDGFKKTNKSNLEAVDGTEAMDLAELSLKRYLALQRAKKKIRMITMWKSLSRPARRSSASEGKIETKSDTSTFDSGV